MIVTLDSSNLPVVPWRRGRGAADAHELCGGRLVPSSTVLIRTTTSKQKPVTDLAWSSFSSSRWENSNWGRVA
jgi:hypothetical protein